MVRKLLSYGLLFTTFAWLLANYVPASLLSIPKLTWNRFYASETGLLIFLCIMALFLGVQLKILYSTHQVFTPDNHEPEKLRSIREFGIRRYRELIWTTVPILMTIATVYAALSLF